MGARIKQLNGTNAWYWLNSPLVSYSNHVRYVNATGGINIVLADNGTGGVVPALNLKSEIFTSGAGTESEPYRVHYFPIDEPAYVELSNRGVATWERSIYAASYDLNLYKDSVKVGSTINIASGARAYDFSAKMREYGAGAYTVKVTAKSSKVGYSSAVPVASNSRTVEMLANPANFTWDGKVAKWDAVANAVSYDVKLIRYQTEIPGSLRNITSVNLANGVDYSDLIGDENTSIYRFKVLPKGF